MDYLYRIGRTPEYLESNDSLHLRQNWASTLSLSPFLVAKCEAHYSDRFILYLRALEHLALSIFPNYLSLLLTAALLPLMFI